jgi:hypothetical protein
MKHALRLSLLVALLRSTMALFPERRTGDNCQYAMETFGMTAFSTFFMQSPSGRSHDTWLKQLNRNGNAARLFGLDEVPCANQVRTVLDEVAPRDLIPVYDEIFQRLDRSGLLRTLRGFQQDLLIPLDGTRYFTSKHVSCPQCSISTEQDGSLTYSHTALLPSIVMPGSATVLPLAPEFLRPQDGQTKQDSEIAAAKRWIADFRRRHKTIRATILGDDLYAKQPMCETVLSHRLNFIFVCKPGSHPTLYAAVDALRQQGRLHSKQVRCYRNGRGEIDYYTWAVSVPLRDGDDAMAVAWFDVTTADERTGEVVYTNAFITNHPVSDSTVAPLAVAGRSRWKIENETHNTLKNHGYNLTHNYGHGQQFLSSLLVSRMLLAFLVHALLELTQQTFRRLRMDLLPSRRELFADLRTLLRYLSFQTFHHLFDFMVSCLDREYAPG